MRYVVSRVDDRKCRLQVSGQVNFSKSTMMKGMIEGGAQKGMKQAMTDLHETIMPHIVRRRTGGACLRRYFVVVSQCLLLAEFLRLAPCSIGYPC